MHFADNVESDILTIDRSNNPPKESFRKPAPIQAPVSQAPVSQTQPPTQEKKIVSEAGLPFDFRVLFIAETAAFAAIELDGEQQVASEGDLLFDTDVIVVGISNDHVVVKYNNSEFTLYPSTHPNAEHASTSRSRTQKDPLLMTAEEIGTQPRIISHVVRLIPTPYIADGVLADVGMNPKLFKQAGLQPDDVIKKINGKVVANAEQFAAFESEFHTYDTLVFEIERKGRRLTLYLDIPGDSPEFSR
ncbi:MAG: hypothetical protein AAGJ37_11460 [Pseudomonadota bacterium]